jgi:hypothetical protein
LAFGFIQEPQPVLHNVEVTGAEPALSAERPR